jgi:hypothetical protein
MHTPTLPQLLLCCEVQALLRTIRCQVLLSLTPNSPWIHMQSQLPHPTLLAGMETAVNHAQEFAPHSLSLANASLPQSHTVHMHLPRSLNSTPPLSC